ncbi:hypothetical protein P4O66_015798 [Electrophorus voltai]|uniref:Low density lipoprotein receptor class A domain containing 3 n=1 Tax=Electrophorus voltai TaxID=2609070 RepID=A0AAD8YXJ4_9TELE|nr:hypothetical protein P4O66_015798 [Electrophorus voltai]
MGDHVAGHRTLRQEIKGPPLCVYVLYVCVCILCVVCVYCVCILCVCVLCVYVLCVYIVCVCCVCVYVCEVIQVVAGVGSEPQSCWVVALSSNEESPGQDFVTLDYRLRYYPSITYAVIGSAVVFVLVVSLLALVLHHQRKRSVLLPRASRGGPHHHNHHHHQQHHHHHHHQQQQQQQPLLLSRLVIVDRGPVHAAGPRLPLVSSSGPFSSGQSLQLLTGTLYARGAPLDSPPSYSQAVLDVSRPPWFDLPPPPYPPDADRSSEREPPIYEAPAEVPDSDSLVREAARAGGSGRPQAGVSGRPQAGSPPVRRGGVSAAVAFQ